MPTWRANPLTPACDQWCEFPVSDRPNAVRQFFQAAREDPTLIKVPTVAIVHKIRNAAGSAVRQVDGMQPCPWILSQPIRSWLGACILHVTQPVQQRAYDDRHPRPAAQLTGVCVVCQPSYFSYETLTSSLMQAAWLLMIETDYVWVHPLQAPRAEDTAAPSLAFHFDYIRPDAPNLEKV